MERRRNHRFSAQEFVGIEYPGGRNFIGWTRDISSGGLFVELDVAGLPVHSLARLRIPIENEEKFSDLRIPVAITRHTQEGIGLLYCGDYDHIFKHVRAKLEHTETILDQLHYTSIQQALAGPGIRVALFFSGIMGGRQLGFQTCVITDLVKIFMRPAVGHIAGVEVHRRGLQDILSRLVLNACIPVAATLTGKSVVGERHAAYLGIYEGAMGPEPITLMPWSVLLWVLTKGFINAYKEPDPLKLSTPSCTPVWPTSSKP